MSRYGAKVNKLISAIKGGDNQAYNRLFDLTYNHLIAVARMYLVDKNDCEDVVSEAFLHVFKYSQNFNEEMDGYNWLCRTVQNIAYTYNAKHQQTVGLSGEIAVSSDIEQYLYLKSDIAAALAKYPKELQELVYMKFWQDKSYAEIAREKGLKKSYVHKKVNWVIKKILKDFQNNVDD